MQEYSRKDYHEMGTLYSNVLNAFAFPHYESIIKDKFNSFFQYDITSKIKISFSFVGYMLAKNNVNHIYNGDYYYKTYIFLDIWEKLIDKNQLGSTYINSNKGHQSNMIRFEVHKDYEQSIKTFTFSERYLQSNLTYSTSSLYRNTKSGFNTLNIIRLVHKKKEENDIDILELIDNGIKILNEIKSFIAFIKEDIISELCKQWNEDHNIYLADNSLDKYNNINVEKE